MNRKSFRHYGTNTAIFRLRHLIHRQLSKLLTEMIGAHLPGGYAVARVTH